jgi:hypothetical protein
MPRYSPASDLGVRPIRWMPRPSGNTQLSLDSWAHLKRLRLQFSSCHRPSGPSSGLDSSRSMQRTGTNRWILTLLQAAWTGLLMRRLAIVRRVDVLSYEASGQPSLLGLL